ncbi:MAG TPA: hypothetical protein VEV43_06745, partial [Actinomycetota bacterium]|nr:hypothetical protein [Actinomycetota bacterium]
MALAAMAVPSAPTALANHPANTCLDLEPEVDSNPTGTAHTITATVRTIAGAGQGSFGTCTGPAPTFSGGTVNIDFEVSGPGDPNEDGPTPETPDLTCNVGAQLGASCTVSYTSTRASRTATDVPEQEAGADEIRGWIDHDGGDPA